VLAGVALLGVERKDFVLILLITGVILSLEIVNSVVERLLDIAKPRLHNYVRAIKDLMAALVLIGGIIAALAGVMILFPYFTD
jgi:diacylglycerol kinase